MATSTVTEPHRGVALLVAVIFTAVMLAFGILLGSLAYKQTLLTQSVKESQNAFYAADTGMECLLYADQSLNLFAEEDGTAVDTPITMVCDGEQKTMISIDTATARLSQARFSLDGDKRCVDLTIYKPRTGLGKTWLFSQGYSVDCDTARDPGGARFSSRGLRAHY